MKNPINSEALGEKWAAFRPASTQNYWNKIIEHKALGKKWALFEGNERKCETSNQLKTRFEAFQSKASIGPAKTRKQIKPNRGFTTNPKGTKAKQANKGFHHQPQRHESKASKKGVSPPTPKAQKQSQQKGFHHQPQRQTTLVALVNSAGARCRYTCRATRVATDFLRILGIFRCRSGIAPHPPPLKGPVAPVGQSAARSVARQAASKKVSHYRGV